MSTAKLYITGLKEPIPITDEQGKKVNKLLENIAVPEEQRVNVADGKWIGAKKLIKYVVFDADDKRHENVKRIFEANVIEKYRKDMQTHLAGREMTKRTWFEFLEKKGAIKVVVTMSPVPGIGEVVDMRVKNFELYQYLDDLKDHIASIDRRSDFEARSDEAIDKKHEEVVEKMKFKI